MIEIVCPSCEARYRLPDGTISENGRRVSCSACGHAWLAYPKPEDREPLKLGPEAVAPKAAEKPSPGAADDKNARPKPRPVERQGDKSYAAFDAERRRSGPSPVAENEDRSAAAPKAFESGGDGPERAENDEAAPGPAAADPRLSEDRAKQMAQIRSMLNEIKKPDTTSDAGSEATNTEQDAVTAQPSSAEHNLREAEKEERDPLREKLEQYKRPGSRSANVGQTKTTKKQGQKVRRRRIEDKRSAGTALTGFLVVVLLASVMATVYLLHPLIIAKVPEAEPAIRDYVATMDAFRSWVAEQVAVLQTTIEGLISDEQA